MRMKKEVEVIAHPDIWAAKYTRWRKLPEHYSGVPFRRELLESLGARFHLTAEPVRITDRFLTTGEIPMVTDYEEIDSGLYDKDTGEMLPDELKDDLALIIDTEYGLVVILGCAHRGIVNTLKRAQQVTGKELIYAAIGGTHLLNAHERPLGQRRPRTCRRWACSTWVSPTAPASRLPPTWRRSSASAFS